MDEKVSKRLAGTLLDVQVTVQLRFRGDPKLGSVLVFVAVWQMSLESARALLSCTNSCEYYFLHLPMSPKSKKRLRKRTERCTGCRRRFTPTGYWQHLRQTTKPACIAVRDTEARYHPLPSDESTTSSTSLSTSCSPSRSPSPSPAQSTDDHDQDPDVPPQPFEGDYYGDYEAGDFDDFDNFNAAMEVDPTDSVNNEVDGASGSEFSGDDGGLGEVELVSGEMGKDEGVVEADICMS